MHIQYPLAWIIQVLDQNILGLHDIGRIKYLSTTDEQSLAAFKLCSSLEGIIPALEPAHALHITGKLASERKGQIIIMNMCGRGDKDLSSVLPLIMKNNS